MSTDIIKCQKEPDSFPSLGSKQHEGGGLVPVGEFVSFCAKLGHHFFLCPPKFVPAEVP